MGNLTDRQKKKIIADYLQTESYRATARLNKVSDRTVKRVVQQDGDFAQKAEQKKAENTADMLRYMESRRAQAQEAIDVYLHALTAPDKVELTAPDKVEAATLSQIATALGILIDKWTKTAGTHTAETMEDDPITQSLKEEAAHSAFPPC